MNRPTEANYRRLIEVDSKARGENHPFVASEIDRLGRTLGFQERHEEALAEYTAPPLDH